MLDIKTVDGKKIDYPKIDVSSQKWAVDIEGDVLDLKSKSVVARVRESAFTTSRKDAHLIAAAPDLLAACEIVHKKITTLSISELVAQFESIEPVLGAAIAKAKGG